MQQISHLPQKMFQKIYNLFRSDFYRLSGGVRPAPDLFPQRRDTAGEPASVKAGGGQNMIHAEKSRESRRQYQGRAEACEKNLFLLFTPVQKTTSFLFRSFSPGRSLSRLPPCFLLPQAASRRPESGAACPPGKRRAGRRILLLRKRAFPFGSCFPAAARGTAGRPRPGPPRRAAGDGFPGGTEPRAGRRPASGAYRSSSFSTLASTFPSSSPV